ncbi:MAG: hypothetical protein R6U04_03355 [Bacteroidales bacterium]
MQNCTNSLIPAWLDTVPATHLRLFSAISGSPVTEFLYLTPYFVQSMSVKVNNFGVIFDIDNY